jgi:multiple sugar transport system permease protein
LSSKAAARNTRIVMFILMTILTAGFLFPIYWAVTMSFKEKADILVAVPQYFPQRVTLSNYLDIFRKSSYGVFAWNSAKVAIITTSLCVFAAAMAGFALTRFAFKGRKAVSNGIFVIRMVPALVYTVPLYMIYNQMGLLDNHMGLILAYCTFSLPISIWLFLSFYEEVPREIYESGVIDGCSEYRLFRSIALPLVVPSISVVAILCFIGSWNEFGLALTLTFKEAYKTLPIAINTMIQRERDTPFGSLAAAGTLAMLPAIILSLTTQKYIVKGFTAGAVKG